MSRPSIQPKLKIGAIDDPLEREADRVAESVVSGVDSSTSVTAESRSASPVVQRKCAACASEDEQVQRAVAPGRTHTAPSTDVRGLIDSARPSAQPLPADLRASFEPRFGADFGDVRIQAGPKAHAASQALGARAFTLGSDVFFDQGQYQPNTHVGRKLLAHELTHVVQQRGSNPSMVRRAPALSCEAAPSADEWFGNQQLSEIRLAPVGQNVALLAPGAQGPAVSLVQRALLSWGCAHAVDVLPVHGADGIYGSETRAAVRRVQRANGIDVDGIVGPVTMSVLDREFQPNNPDDDHSTEDDTNGGGDTPTEPEDEFVDPTSNCSATILKLYEHATARIIKARARLEAFANAGAPAEVGPTFLRAFGRDDPASMQKVVTNLNTAELLLDNARPGILDGGGGGRKLRCYHDGEHPTCDPDRNTNAFVGTEEQPADSPGGVPKSVPVIGICIDKPGSDELKSGDIVHEAMHAVLPLTGIDIYGHLRLFDLLGTEPGLSGDSAAMYNPDNYRFFVMSIDGVTGSVARNGAPKEDHYHFQSDAHRDIAIRAFAFAEAWAYRGESQLDSVLDGFGNWPSTDTWAQHRRVQRMVVMLRNGIKRDGSLLPVVIDQNVCNTTLASPRFPEIDCPLDTANRRPVGTVIRIYDMVNLKLLEKLHQKQVSLTEVQAGNADDVTWLLRSKNPHLLLGPGFFGLAFQDQIKQLLIKLASAQGVSRRRPNDIELAVDFLSDNFYSMYNTLMPSA